MRRRGAFAFALALSALVAAPHAARAACELDAGTGGTGFESGSGTGTGGTGFDPGSGSGTGGTGHSGAGGTGISGAGGTGLAGTGGTGISGMGGTGVIGTITGFGSVCINGLEVDYDASVDVEVDGRKASVDALAVGQVARIRAIGDGAGLRARAISVETAVAGPIEGFDAATGRLRVMGQSIAIDASTVRAAALDAGTRVAVSGLRRPDGVVVASRVEPRPSAAPDVVTGRAIGTGERAVYVGDVRAAGALGARARRARAAARAVER
ncbi:MAG: hypothetical protein KC560_16975, partial [Myxococcales bacterium]|nr:hypothetical protein [Myxococcales bacterium]